MSLLKEHLDQVDNHWSVLAIGSAERDRGLTLADARLVRKSIGRQMHLSTDAHPGDDDLL